MKLKGIGSSNGVSIAKAYLIVEKTFAIENGKVDNVEKEINRFKTALNQTVEQIENIKEITKKKLGEEKAAIFEAHIQIASDPEITLQIEDLIKEGYYASFAVEKALNQQHDTFLAFDDPYFKERAADIMDIKKRLLANILNQPLPDLLSIKEEVIIVAHDLTPSETALLDKKYVKGFITDIGGRTSHAAIMARTMEIPAVLGLKTVTKNIRDNDIIALDGSSGEVEINPSDIKAWEKKIKEYNLLKDELAKYINETTQTKDGHQVLLESNIGNPNDVDVTKKFGSEGVGLYRSEFLYMGNDHWPTEEEQFVGYKTVLENLKDQLIVIRTLDIGGDKKLSYHEFEPEMNPFLGYRAIRFCLDKKEVFRTQLRALARASYYGKLAVMFPMIATIDEFKQAKNFFLDCIEEVKNEGHKVGKIEIGMMVEIPTSAVLADQFAKEADFFSIGTNDLVQYSFACDRMSKSVSYLYQPNNPALLRLVKMTSDGGHKHKRWVGMCGEMAGDTLSIPILVGLGLDALSMSPSSIPMARKIINNLTLKECQDLANECINLDTFNEVNEKVKNFLKNHNII